MTDRAGRRTAYPRDDAAQVAALPAVAVLFAAFLGYNPIQQLLGGHLSSLPPAQADFLTGRSFFPHLISGPFSDGLAVAFWFAIIACLIGAVASFLCGPRIKPAGVRESVGAELAGIAGEDETSEPDEPGADRGRVGDGERVGTGRPSTG